MANVITLPDFAKMVRNNLHKSIEEAVYDELRPITDRVARNAAKRIAESIKGYAEYTYSEMRGNVLEFEPKILLRFNSEEIKL